MSLTHILGRVDGSRVGVARAFLDNVWTDGRIQPLFSPPHLARLCSLGVMLHLSFLLFSMVLAHFFITCICSSILSSFHLLVTHFLGHFLSHLTYIVAF